MSEFALSQDEWDLVFDDNGNLVFVDGAEETSQNSKFRLQILAGEMFDDTRNGIPWFSDMVDPRVDIDTKKQIIRRAIQGAPGVASIDSIELGYDSETGQMAVNFTGTTTNGDTFGAT